MAGDAKRPVMLRAAATAATAMRCIELPPLSDRAGACAPSTGGSSKFREMRRFSTWLVVTLLALALGCTPTKLIGEALPGAIAPDFTLTDGPTGQVVSLSALRGKVVVVTFLYTSCLDVCPLTAEVIRAARDRMGTSANDVAFTAVSVDPVGDTPATTRRFVQEHGVESTLRDLIRPDAAPSCGWQAVQIAPSPGTQEAL